MTTARRRRGVLLWQPLAVVAQDLGELRIVRQVTPLLGVLAHVVKFF